MNAQALAEVLLKFRTDTAPVEKQTLAVQKLRSEIAKAQALGRLTLDSPGGESKKIAETAANTVRNLAQAGVAGGKLGDELAKAGGRAFGLNESIVGLALKIGPIAPLALGATQAIRGMMDAWSDPRAAGATEKQVAEIDTLKLRAGALLGVIRPFTDKKFWAEGMTGALAGLSQMLGFEEEARSAVAARKQEQVLAAKSAEREAQTAGELAAALKRTAEYGRDLTAAYGAAASAAQALRSFGKPVDLDLLTRKRDSYADAAKNPNLSELARTQAQAEADKLTLQLRQAEVDLNTQLAALGDRQEAARLAKLDTTARLADITASLLETERQLAALPKDGSNATLEKAAKLEGRKLDLEAQQTAAQTELRQRSIAAERLAIDAQLLANQRERAAIDADYSRTEAEKWAERKRLIQEAIRLQEQYLAALAARAADTSLTEATRLEAQTSLASGRQTLGGMQGELSGMGPDPTSTVENIRAQVIALGNTWGTVQQQIAQGFTGGVNTAMQSTSDVLYNLATGAEVTWANATAAIRQHMIRMVTDMVAKLIWKNTVERALIAMGVMQHNAGEAAKTAGSTTGAITRIGLTIKEALASVYHGAIEAFKALAGIPYVGPFLAGAAMAAALAGGIALVGKIGKGFAEGGYTGPGGKYEPAGIVHRGEYVFPQEAVERIGVGRLEALNRGFASGGYAGAMPAAASAGGRESGGVQIVMVDSRREAASIRRNSMTEAQIVNVVRRRRGEIIR